MHNGVGVTRGINHLLDALAPAESQRLDRALSPVFLAVNTVLFEPDRPIESVYFPLNAVVSLVTPLSDGATVEVATVGHEGMVGVPLVPGGSLAVRAVTQMAGWVVRMGAAQFLDELNRQSHLRELVNDYLTALLRQVSQTAVCNRLHSNQERLSRWLLTSHDHAGRDFFDVSRPFLGQLLGCPAVTVALSVGVLEAGGLITYHHGQLTIVDRAGLEDMACECYAVIRRELDRVTAQDSGRHDPVAVAGRVLSGRARSGGRAGEAVRS